MSETFDRTQWLASLKVGDNVACYDFGSRLYRIKAITAITPKRTKITANGCAYNQEGRYQAYHRYSEELRPVDASVREAIQEQNKKIKLNQIIDKIKDCAALIHSHRVMTIQKIKELANKLQEINDEVN